jgi:hypothetical protein
MRLVFVRISLVVLHCAKAYNFPGDEICNTGGINVIYLSNPYFGCAGSAYGVLLSSSYHINPDCLSCPFTNRGIVASGQYFETPGAGEFQRLQNIHSTPCVRSQIK